MSEPQLNKHGVNKVIKANLLPDKQMRDIGFTDYREGYWHFMRCFKAFKSNAMFTNEISFNVSINKNDPEDLRIDVLDEDFCQPYDYQYMLEKNPNSETPIRIQAFVEEWMDYLHKKGVLSGHVKGEYI